jgi:CARDB/Matrixin
MNKQYIKVAGLLLAGVATQAHAYTTWECLGEKLDWTSASQTMRYSSVSFPSGSWRTALDTAIDRVNQNPSTFRFNKSYGDTSIGIDNGQNEAWFSSDPGVLSGAPAITYTQWDCIDYWIFGKDVELTEADVIFDVHEAYTTSMTRGNLWEYGGPYRPFQTTAIHELGHASGLGHTNNTYNIMGTDWQHVNVNGTTVRSYLGEDAANALVYLYGTTSASTEDLGVTHWKYRGTSGEYSTHQKTKVYTNTGGSLSTFTVNGETGYKVSKGQIVRFELTYENNGKSYQSSADVRYYVSTNDLISTGDTQIGSTTFTLARDVVYTTYVTLTIPTTLTSGVTYHLGAIIDADGSLAEMTEANNATYLPIRIN